MTPERRRQAVRDRLGEVKRREAAEGFGAPSCMNCIFGPIDRGTEGLCDHIAHWERQNDPVTGKWAGKPAVTVREARSGDGLCGPEGLLFQPYTLRGKAARVLARTGPLPLFYGALGVLAGLSLLLT